MNNSLIIQKPALPETVTRIRAVSLKPPAFSVEPKSRFFIVYVTEDGKELRKECTKETFLRVNGGPPEANTMRGLDLDIKKDFIILEDTVKKQVIGVHTLPKNSYLRGMFPANMEGRKTMTLQLLASGEIDVVELPPKMSKQLISTILAGVDALTELKPGDQINGVHRVVSASGNQLIIEPQIRKRGGG
jgi:hypothetical protein